MVTKIKKAETETSGLEKHLKPVTEFIDEIYSKITVKHQKCKDVINIDFARYPFTTDGEVHFYIKSTKNVVIDIENLEKRFKEICFSLKSLSSMYDK